MKNINEEIKRIKSLFTEERLYGNLISEQPYATDSDGDGNINEPEAKSFLQSLGYIIKAKNDDDVCLRPGSDIKKLYEKVKSLTNVGFMLETTNIGCALTIYSKNPAKKIRQLSFFEGPTGTRFNMIVKPTNTNYCKKDLHDHVPPIPAGVADFVANTKGYISSTTPPQFGLDLQYIKVDGKWSTTGSNINILDGFVEKLLNEKLKPIKSRVNFSIYNQPIPGFTNSGTERGGNKEWMDDGSGTCITINDYLKDIVLGNDVNSTFDVINLITTKM